MQFGGRHVGLRSLNVVPAMPECRVMWAILYGAPRGYLWGRGPQPIHPDLGKVETTIDTEGRGCL